MKRIRPLNPFTLQHLHCFKPDQLEKILTTEPEGTFLAFTKSNRGILSENCDVVVRQGKPGTTLNNFNYTKALADYITI